MRITTLRFISAFGTFFSIFYFVSGLFTQDIAVLSLSVFLLWISALLYGCSKDQINIIYVFFLITFFIFLLSRIMVRWLTEREIYSPFSEEIMIHTYICLYLSLLGLLIGAMINVQFTFGHKEPYRISSSTENGFNDINLRLLRQLSAIFAIIAGFATLAVNIEKIAFYGVTGSGAELRTVYASSLPGIVLRLSYIYVLMLCIFLAAKPSKRSATLMFLQYLAISATKMMFGSRCDFVLGLMFMVAYFLIRDHMNVKEGLEGADKWFGKKEMMICIISIPLLVILLQFVEYYRVQDTFSFSSFWDTLLDFFESQGTSVDIIGYTYKYADKLDQPHFLYLFDNTWTFLSTNPISSAIFGTQSYSTNSLERALYGTSLDQSLYYIINPESYLSGKGCGSSYVAEAFLGYGYIGTFLVSLFLSMFMKKFYEFDFNKLWKTVIALIFIQQLFFMPRAGFDEFVGDFASVTHIIAVLALWIAYRLLNQQMGWKGVYNCGGEYDGNG